MRTKNPAPRSGRPESSCIGLLLALSLVSPLSNLTAQPEPSKVGVALSGGGARGIAHVGVLRALEEMRIPVHFIGGTSMGAVVGGLYASGMSPAEIEAALEEVDWQQVLGDVPPRRSLEFRRREDGRRYRFEIEAGLDGSGIRLPGGLIPPQELSLLLRRHTLHVAAIDTFADLPIPFLSVATDIESGHSVVMREGDLAEALLASASIPILFAPAEVENRLLVDGGLTNNLPVDLVRSMGADVVIAVDVSMPLEEPGGAPSLLDVLEQTIAIVSRTRVGEQRDRADLLITPDVGDLGLFQFEAVDRFVELGATAAREAAPRMESLALSPSDYEGYRRRYRSRPALPPRIEDVRFDVPVWLDRRKLDETVASRPGDSLVPSRIEADVQRLYAMGEFEQTDYDLVVADGRHDLTIEAEQKTWGPNYLHLGVRLITDSGGDDFRTGLVTFQGVANLTRTRIGARGAEWRTDVRVGRSSGFFSEWYQPLDLGGRWFVAGSGTYASDRQPLFEAGRLEAEYGVDRATIALDVGRNLGRSTELRAGIHRGWIDADVDAGSADLPSVDVDNVLLFSRLIVDRLDQVHFPRRGVFARLEAALSRRGLGSHRSYDRLEIEAKAFASRGRYTGFASLSGGTSLGSPIPGYDEFLLGGFLSLTGFGEDALRGAYSGVLRAGGYYRFARLPPAMRGLYLAGWVEGGNAWRRAADIGAGELHLTGTAAIGADTILGPLFLAYGAATGGDDRVYLALGEIF